MVKVLIILFFIVAIGTILVRNHQISSNRFLITVLRPQVLVFTTAVSVDSTPQTAAIEDTVTAVITDRQQPRRLLRHVDAEQDHRTK